MGKHHAVRHASGCLDIPVLGCVRFGIASL